MHHTGKYRSDYEEQLAIQNYNYNYFNPERYEEYFKFKKIIMTIIILSKTFGRKMENFPYDLVEHIISFACDRRGYNSIEYHKRVEDNKPRMKRIILELLNWNKCSIPYNDRISVSWLKLVKQQKMQSKNLKKV